MSTTKKEFGRFLIVGSLTVGIDFIIYSLCLWLELPINPAKAIGFLTGTVFAYVANRSWTFESGADGHPILRFMAVYLSNLVVNVSINAAIVWLLGEGKMELLGAFLIATGVSATLNFLGMKYLVFRTNQT